MKIWITASRNISKQSDKTWPHCHESSSNLGDVRSVGTVLSDDSNMSSPTIHRSGYSAHFDRRHRAQIGSLIFIQRNQTLEIRPQVSGLSPGPHAMHIHEHGSCAPSRVQGITIPGGAAGGHYHGSGHHRHHHHGSAHRQRPAGDLPELVVDSQGKATGLIVSDRLRLHELKGRSVVIHAESEQNGGGARVACGVIL